VVSCEAAPSLVVKISSALPGTQDDCRRERLGIKETDVKWGQASPALFLLLLIRRSKLGVSGSWFSGFWAPKAR
jgi:hypothetical protein